MANSKKGGEPKGYCSLTFKWTFLTCSRNSAGMQGIAKRPWVLITHSGSQQGTP